MSPLEEGRTKAHEPVRDAAGEASAPKAWQISVHRAFAIAAGPEDVRSTGHTERGINYLQIERSATYVAELIEEAARMEASLIVVSAADGPLPSTRERIILARELKVESIVVILTDSESVSEELVSLAERDTRELLETYGFTDVPFVRITGVSSGASADGPGAPPGPPPSPPSAEIREPRPVETDDLDKGVIRVWYATNRRPADADDPNRGYSGARATELSYGSCDVFIPACHKMGSIGSSFLKRILTLKDDRLKLRKTRRAPAAAHWKEIAARLSEAKPDKRHALVFIHGYNVPFKQAALRTAQIAADLSFPGPASFFSWPSWGRLADYIKDAASIEASEADIARYLTEFAERSGATSIHVVAHSMGNRGLLRAINRIVNEQPEPLRPLFDQIILAAADVDRQVFSDLAPACCQMGRRTTMYVSARDRAVGASEWLHDFPRAGLVPPVTVLPRIDTINVTNVDLTRLGHGYIAESRDVLHDMRDVMLTGEPAGERFAHRQATTPEGGVYWIIGA